MGGLCQNKNKIKKTACFPKQLYHFTFPPQCMSSVFSTPTSTFGMDILINFVHSNRCVVIGHHNLACTYLLTGDVEHLLCT